VAIVIGKRNDQATSVATEC